MKIFITLALLLGSTCAQEISLENNALFHRHNYSEVLKDECSEIEKFLHKENEEIQNSFLSLLRVIKAEDSNRYQILSQATYIGCKYNSELSFDEYHTLKNICIKLRYKNFENYFNFFRAWPIWPKFYH